MTGRIRSKNGVSTLDIWPWKYLIPWMREDLFAWRDARKRGDARDIKDKIDSYNMEAIVMPLHEFINYPVAHDIIHNGATFQVAGLTNNSNLAKSHEVCQCVRKYQTLGEYVLEIAKKRLYDMLYVGLIGYHRESATMFANAVGAQMLYQLKALSSSIARAANNKLDGTYPCPPPFFTSPDSSETPNPAYITWFQTDQTLICLINATLSEPVLSQVVGLSTSHDIWQCLQQNFSQHSLANATHLRFQLLSITKGSKSISEYLQNAKSISDALAAINQPVSNADLVTSVLRGLGPDYTMLVIAILNFPPLPAFSDPRAHILSFDSHNAHPQVPNSPSTIALLTSRSNSNHHRGGHSFYKHRGGRQGRGGRGFSSDSSNSPYNHFYNFHRGGKGYRGRSHSTYQQGLLGPSPYSTPQCQICSKFGHSAATCYSRYRNHNNDEDISVPFAGLQIASQIDLNWYPDSGTTNHMTGDARSMTNRSDYAGSNHIQLGNGDSLPIAQTELSSSFPDSEPDIIHLRMTVGELMEAYEVCISSLQKAQARRRTSSLKRIFPANFSKEAHLQVPEVVLQKIISHNSLDVELYKYAQNIFAQQQKHVMHKLIEAERNKSVFNNSSLWNVFLLAIMTLLLVTIFVLVNARRKTLKLKV
ncbi:hypothetical protein HHK36_011163 [Tetracentron sinense]|uniref:Uncharacterized protein n=1 Tax=Tetracentron sinense TaxID=13715 RepID=A0A835DK68_TETSI|nr:hypothetical protein HHK36_011163 [Tetracentron sinense]